ncbi:acyltransferase [Idiomarina piscisalsi]|uniref:Acyltransferase n=1 Tax=Idiomarina piscisalsi TaxID=1096243 RepID=A0ABN5ARV9_9GAMM|nr:acyltransferase family protein [Idiomarina piscisalsi]ASG66419.1 acyltransferase [Idiomarina piscisalsi]
MKFRSDIQILRGISVLLVVLFHLGFDLFKSGLLGVDVFFVISGFLMAVLYSPSDNTKFFRRRAIRLLPSYYVAIAATVIFSFLLTTRSETTQVVEQAVWASFFASNIGFWLENSYFNQSAFKPLLHLWSLGVEIQFYLLVPFISFFIRKSKWLLPFFLLSSLALCFWAVSVSPKTAFFITPFRIWQFLIGYGIAMYFTNGGNVRSKKFSWLGGIGVLLLFLTPLAPLEGESFSAINGHPGLIALIISCSVALTLIFGLPEVFETSFFGKILEVLGKYSYAIYLTHFPIIVIYNSAPFEGTYYGVDSWVDLIFLTFFIGLFSYLLYNFAERKKLPNVLTEHWKKATLMSALAIFFLVLVLNFLQEKSLSTQERLIFSASGDRAEFRCGRVFRLLNPSAMSCELTGLPESEIAGSIMLAGNSHANSIKESFRKAALLNGYHLWFFVSNSTMNVDGPSPQKIVNEAVKKGVSIIYIHQSAMAFDKEMLRALLRLSKDNGIDVVYVEPVPVWRRDIPKAMYYQAKNQNAELVKTIDQYYEENEQIFLALEQLSESFSFSRIKTSALLCKENCMYKLDNGKPLYFDNHHLTETGSSTLYPLIRKKVTSFGLDADNE